MNETNTARASMSVVFFMSSAPKACAVRPLVPMRMNPQFQYMKLNIETPTARAPMVAADPPHCPAMTVPAIPMMGTVMFETTLGSANRNISRFMPMVLYDKSQQRYNFPFNGGQVRLRGVFFCLLNRCGGEPT